MITLILTALLAQPAAEAAAPSGPAAITQPDWLRRPSGDDLARFFPREAMRKGQSGRAVISCSVTATGALANCSVVAEDPPGAGFGAAAVAMASKFEMRPMTRNGQPVAGGAVRIPINFATRPTMPVLKEAMICYGIAADAADADPTSEAAWRALTAWSGWVATNVFQAGGRPSEYEAKLGDARRAARKRRAIASAEADRRACDEGLAKLAASG